MIISRDFAHGYGFARQRGLIGLQILRLQQDGVGRYPVSFGNNDEVATHDVPAGDSLALAVANHQGARAGEVAQRIQNPLSARLLHHGDHDRHGGEGDQDDSFFQVTKRQIDDAPDEKK